MTSLDVAWIHGAPEGLPCDDPPLQVHRVDESTYLLRQSKALSYEGAFLYLLLGSERALLLDTGDISDPAVMPLRATVDSLLDAVAGRPPSCRVPTWSSRTATPTGTTCAAMVSSARGA